ncbi:MAG: DUF4197 domain-containing protein [Acidobacteriota bacterium]|nr:DUF4197 domain-containing protein [Blastocatellia bacterium]MDW8239177.1 DUF4197 domain-containing protein [Acidobacteriota bacterium]
MSFTVILILMLSAISAAQVDRVLERLGLGHRLSESQIVAGLKEALQVGTTNTVKQTGRVDGYFKNQAIKILLPEKLRKMEAALRFAGYGPQIDQLVLSMNRAAEQAAPRAKSIFWDAIKQMTFEDARAILNGPETAATDYFRRKTTPHLISAFKPIVQQAMNDVGVTRRYKEVLGRSQNIPFVKTEPFDLDQYVVEKSLDGLFYVLGEEERKIRRDPAARVTKLLRDVFAS